MHTPDTIRTIVEQANDWTIAGRLFTARLPDGTKVELRKNELDRLDLRLAPLIKHLSARIGHDGMSPPGEIIRNSYANWHGKYPVVHDKHLFKYKVDEFLEIKGHVSGTLGLKIRRAQHYPCTVKLSRKYVEMEMISYMSEVTIFVREEELDALYPGWQQRYSAAMTLGYSPKEQASMVFSHAVIVNTETVPDITF